MEFSTEWDEYFKNHPPVFNEWPVSLTFPHETLAAEAAILKGYAAGCKLAKSFPLGLAKQLAMYLMSLPEDSNGTEPTDVPGYKWIVMDECYMLACINAEHYYDEKLIQPYMHARHLRRMKLLLKWGPPFTDAHVDLVDEHHAMLLNYASGDMHCDYWHSHNDLESGWTADTVYAYSDVLGGLVAIAPAASHTVPKYTRRLIDASIHTAIIRKKARS